MNILKKLVLSASAFLALFLLVGLFSQVKAITVEPLVSTYDFITTDNGMQGLWATDNFHSTVTITPQREACYQVVREDGGTFESLSGAKSPGGSEGTLIGEGTTGSITGGITLTICGALRPTPLANDTPEDLRGQQYANYAVKYFHRYFSEIGDWNITSWGWKFTTCNNGSWTDNDETEGIYNSDGPNETMGDINGDFVPCRQEPTPTPAPFDACPNLDGIQGGLPEGYHYDNDRKNCLQYQFGGPQNSGSTGQVLGASTQGQVLGATTMAKTGGFEETFFMTLMAMGGVITSFGLKKLAKKN